MLCEDLERWDGREDQEGGDISVHMGGSRCCTAETNTAV